MGGVLNVLRDHVLGLEVYVYLKYTRRDITAENGIQLSVIHSTASEEVKRARSYYYRVKLMQNLKKKILLLHKAKTS